jgi:excisionase family DNA binding protein
MISLNQTISPKILNNHISVHAAALYSGYCLQYLRRLLRNGKLEGVKIGQLWLIDKSAIDLYLEQTQDATDQRFGPR